MASDSVYRIVDVVGVSEKSWEDAGRNAVETAAGSLRDLRVAEVTKMDMRVENGKVTAFRTRVALSLAPFRIAPENGPRRLVTACRMSAKSGREQSQQGSPYSITSSARSHSGRPPNMNTTPAQLEAPRPTPPRYLV